MKKIYYLALITCLVALPISFAAGNANGQTPPQITQPQNKLTGLPAEIEAKAKEITVRIIEELFVIRWEIDKVQFKISRKLPNYSTKKEI